MAVEDVSEFLGTPAEAPYDLIWARQDSMDYHRFYGMPLIIKRNYSSDHIAVGEGPHGEWVSRDDTYDEAYGQGIYSPTSAISQQNKWGYSDGWFTYGTLLDASLEFEPGTRGAYKKITPQFELPWYPLLHDGDLIVTTQIQKSGNQITILATGDRYIIQAVNEVTMRGEAPFYTPNQESETTYYQDVNRLIAQTCQVVRMPRYHFVYDIPALGGN